MSYQVLARKWRPASFKEMVGQEHVLQALVNALDSGRLHHAYLFSGTRGVGKTTVARIFAKALNCDKGVGANPCGECSSCTEIDQGRSIDLLEIDAASRTGVDDMRELLDNVQYAPTRSRFKVYLIDEVHMLSKHSFNALLKTLEEPPPHVKFLLATTDPQKVPVTVLSRCLQFHLKRMSRAQILAHLQFLMGEEGITAEDSALARLAAAADGSLRDALSLTDQAIGYGGGEVAAATVEAMLGAISQDYLIRLLDALGQRDAATLLGEARAVIDNHPDYQRICAELIALLQQVAIHQADPRLADADAMAPEAMARYAQSWSPDEVQLYYQILLQGRQDLSISPDEAAGFEMLMLRLLAFAPEAAPDGDDELKKNTSARLTSSTHRPPLSVPSGGERAAALTPSAPAPPATDDRSAPSPPSPVEIVPAINETTVEPVIDADPAVVSPHEPPAPGSDPSASEPAARSEATANVKPAEPAPDSPPCDTAMSDSSDSSGALDWSNTAYHLGLVGLAQEIVANSIVDSRDDDAIVLALPPELAELVNDVIAGEIRAALQQQCGVSLGLDFVARDRLTGETPAQARARRLEQERLDAIEAIRQDDAVRRLQNAFAVELDENSVVRQTAKTTEEVM